MAYMESVLALLPSHYSLPLFSLVLSILQELRHVLDHSARFDAWCIQHLQPMRDVVLHNEFDSSIRKSLLFFLLCLHDASVESFVDSHYAVASLEAVTAYPSEVQELAALRFLQTHITSENYEREIDSILNTVFDNRNMNTITPLSAMESDAVLSYLLRVVVSQNANLYTQNIIYWLKYFAKNISFPLIVQFLTTPLCGLGVCAGD